MVDSLSLTQFLDLGTTGLLVYVVYRSLNAMASTLEAIRENQSRIGEVIAALEERRRWEMEILTRAAAAAAYPPSQKD